MLWPSRDLQASSQGKYSSARQMQRSRRRRSTSFMKRPDGASPLAVESLEGRALLAANASVNPQGVLQITLDAANDEVDLTSDGTKYFVSGTGLTSTPFLISSVTGGVSVTGTTDLGQKFTFKGATALTQSLTVASSVEITSLQKSIAITAPNTGISIGSGDITIATNSIITTEAQFYSGDVTLAQSTTLSAGAGALSFSGNVSGPFDLTLNSAGLTTFGDSVNVTSLTTDAVGTTAINGGTVTAITQTYNDVVSLGNNTTLIGVSGSLSAVVGNFKDLTLNFSATETIDGASWLNIGSLKTDGAGTTRVRGTIVTNARQQYGSNVLLLADTVIDAGGSADAIFDGPINGNFGLTVRSLGMTKFSGAVGGLPGQQLTSLTTDAGGITNISGGGITTSGNQAYNDNVTLTSVTTLTGATPTFGGTVDAGNNNLTLNFSGVTTIGSNFSNLASLTTDAAGSTELSGTVSATGAQTYNDPVALKGSTTLSGVGSVVFNAPVTGSAGLSITATAGATLAANVTTAGNQSYTATVTLADDVTLSGATPTFTAGVTGANNSLTLNFTGVTTIDGAQFTGIKNLSIGNGGTTQLTGALTTTGSQTYGDAVTLSGDTALESSNGENLTFLSTVNGTHALVVKTAGMTSFGAAIGSIAPLTSLTTDAVGSTKLGGNVTTTGSQAFGDGVTLTANVVATSSDNKNIAFDSTVDGPYALTVNTTGITSFTASVGSANPLSQLTTNASGSTQVGGDVFTTGAQLFGDAVTVLMDQTAFDGSSITFGSGVNAAGLDLFITAAGGAITSSAAPIQADALSLAAAAGVNAKTTVTTLDATLTGGNLVITETDGITLGNIANVTTANGNLQLSAGGAVVIGQVVDAGAGNVSLASDGGITSLVGAGTAIVNAAGLTLVNTGTGAINLPVVAVSSLSVKQDAPANVDITNLGSLTIGIGTIGIATKGDATIRADNGLLTLAQASTVTGAKTLTLEAPLGITQAATGTLAGASGTLAATTGAGGGAIILTNSTGNTIGNLTGSTNGGDFSYFTSADLVVNAIATFNGDIALFSGSKSDLTLDGAINAGSGDVKITSISGGSIAANATASLTTVGGDVQITTLVGGSIETPTTVSNGGDVTTVTQSGGDIAIEGAITAAGGDVLVQAVTSGAIDSTTANIATTGGGSITLRTGTVGAITTGNLSTASGAVTLATSGTAANIDTTAGTVTTQGGLVTATTGAGGDIYLADVFSNGGNQSYTTGPNGDFDSIAGVLSSNGGAITVTAPGTGSITTAAVTSTGGAIRLDAGSTAADAILMKGDVSADVTGRITLASGGGISDDAASKITANQLVIERSNEKVTLNQLGNDIGALALLNTSASINAITSRARSLTVGITGVATPGIQTANGDVSIDNAGFTINATATAEINIGAGILSLEAEAIALASTAHQVNKLAAAATGTAGIAFKAAGDLAIVSGTKATGGVLDGLSAQANGAQITLTAVGAVTQNTAAFPDASIGAMAGQLTISASNVALTNAKNDVLRLQVNSDGSISYVDFDDVSIGINGLAGAPNKAGGVSITAGDKATVGNIMQFAPVYAGSLSATASGSVSLGSSLNDVNGFTAQSGPSAALAPVGIVFADANDVTLGDVLADGTPGNGGYVVIRVGGSIQLRGELTYDTDTPGCLVLEHGAGGSTTFVVTSTGDLADPADITSPAAALTLRQRINYVNDNAVIAPQDEYITFAIDNFFPIGIDTQLPTIERKVTLGPAEDSIANPDYRIAIDGSKAGANGAGTGGIVNGLTLGYGNAQGLGSNGSVIRGLVVYGFSGSAIVVNSSGNTVTNNWIGITRGSETKGNGAGIELVSSKVNGTTVLASSNTIDDNVISGNQGAGILIRDQATLNTVVNNLIGTNPFGTIPIGNGGYGIEIVGSNRNTIGGVDQGNTIVNNTAGGLKISGTLSSGTDFLANTILRNTIGNNSGNGIEIDTSIGNVIGSAGAGNTIQDNKGAGISITGARATSLAAGNIVQANTISLNDLGGITLENAAFQTISGGNAITSNGLFATNTGAGIAVLSTKANSLATNNVIVGNFIGTDSSGAVDGGNADAGILLEGAVNTNIGTATAGDGNVVSFNRRDGIRITNGDEGGNPLLASGNRLRGNTIRFNSSLGNEGQAGILISGGKQNAVGGTNPGEGNVISDNNAHGVLISAGANKAHAEGNRVAGNTVHANELDGISVSDSDFDSIDGGNVITASGRDGISLVLASQSTRILGNRIGVDAAGLTAGNSRHGIFIEAASGITIGDAAAAGRNVIGGNGAGPSGGDGVHLVNGANDVTIRNNLIGLTPTGSVGANSLAGIRVAGTNAATITGLVIGGSATNEGNIISGNGLSGIVLEETDAAIIRGNRIGTDIAGSLAIANGADGIQIVAGAGNLIGGTAATAGNLISGNAGSGISVDGGVDHLILGNRIGTNAAASAALANLAHGIEVTGNGTSVIVGGTAAGSSNTIAGNAIDGIHIVDGKATVLGNFIGTNAASVAGLGNDGDGVAILGGTATAVGDGSAGGRNIISGNEGRGILLGGGSDAQIQGNLIGTNVAGTTALANGTQATPQAGIRIAGANNATVSSGNVVSGNTGNGIELVGVGTTAAIITGNRVGTNAAGAAAIGNGAAGIALVSAGASDIVGPPAVVNRNIIGGLGTNDGNLVSGNASHGIAITGSTNALIAHNTIGLDLNGGLLGNAGSGVTMTASTDIDVTYRNQIAANAGHGVLVTGGSGNSIGADAAQANKGLNNGNTITRNKLDGIRIDGGATNTIVAANVIGAIGLGNSGRGISVIASSGNTIGGSTVGGVPYGNLVVANGSDGIAVLNTPAANSVLGNNVRVNAGRGILLENSDNQAIGGAALGEGNTVVLNSVHGIELRNDADANNIVGNFVGTNSLFAGGLGNAGAGIRIGGGLSQGNSVEGNRVQANVLGGVVLDGAVNNSIGGNKADQANTIVLNKVAGVSLIGNASLNTVSGNLIGTDAAAATGAKLGNLGDGVSIQGSVGNSIGGLNKGDGNTIRANQAGVHLVNAVAINLGAGNVVAGNAVDANLREGIRLFASSFNTIGDDNAGNVITRNAGDGIAVTIGSASNIVQGNTVGGSPANANAGAGIRVVGSTSNTLRANDVGNNLANGIVVSGAGKTAIGGMNVADSNTITANVGDGVLLTDAATQTTIFSNEIAANTGNGVSVQRSTGNTIGTANAGNSITGNSLDGILVASVSASTVIQGNEIGGALLEANGGNGIRVAGAFGTLIGGTLPGQGNTVSENTAAGIAIEKVASRTVGAATRVFGNTISNAGGVGIAVAGSTNQIIGGSAAGQANTLSENNVGLHITGGSTGTLVTGNTIEKSATHGIAISGSLANTISNNTVTGAAGDGIRVTQAAARSVTAGNRILSNSFTGNVGAGVRLTSGTRYTTVGAAGQENTIGGNAIGVTIEGTSTNNVVANNFIGIDRKAQNIGNTAAGIEVIGSVTNVLRGNAVANNATGIRIVNTLAATPGAGNQVFGNTIGDNTSHGIEIVGGGRQTIGSTAAGTANTITKNGGHGISIVSDANGVGSIGNVLRGNFIGTTASGTAGLGNSGSGISIQGGSRNEISSGNVIRSNVGDGVTLAGSSTNTIGGSTAAAGNTISSNTGNGVTLAAGSSANVVAGNVVSGNTKAGIAITDATSLSNVVGMRVVGGSSAGRGNTITANQGGGVVVDGAARNQIFANFMSGNTNGGTVTPAAGIVLQAGGNGNAVTPAISAATFVRRTLTITGTIAGASRGSSYWIDVFSNGVAGTVQANQPLGRVLARIGLNGAFTASLTLPSSVFVPTGDQITATATDAFGNTSAISAPRAVA